MSGLAELAFGLVIMLGAAGIVQLSHDPDRTGRRLAAAVAGLFVVAFAVWIARGDLFRPSGIETDGSGCGYERVC